MSAYCTIHQQNADECPCRPAPIKISRPAEEMRQKISELRAALSAETRRREEAEAHEDIAIRQRDSVFEQLRKSQATVAALVRWIKKATTKPLCCHDVREAKAMLANLPALSQREAAFDALRSFYKLYKNSGNWRQRGKDGCDGSQLELTISEATALERASDAADVALARLDAEEGK